MKNQLFEQELKKIVNEIVFEKLNKETICEAANPRNVGRAVKFLRRLGKVGKWGGIAAGLGSGAYYAYQQYKNNKRDREGLDNWSKEIGWKNSPIERAVRQRKEDDMQNNTQTVGIKTQPQNTGQKVIQQSNEPTRGETVHSPKGWTKKYPKEIH